MPRAMGTNRIFPFHEKVIRSKIDKIWNRSTSSIKFIFVPHIFQNNTYQHNRQYSSSFYTTTTYLIMPSKCIKCGTIKVPFAGCRCAGCTSELFYGGKKRKNLTKVEKSQFDLHQYGKENLIKKQKNDFKTEQRKSKISKSATVKSLNNIPLSPAEQLKMNSRNKHNETSKRATVNTTNNIPLSPAEQIQMNSRNKRNETSKRATVNTNNNIPLSHAEQMEMNCRKRSCETRKMKNFNDAMKYSDDRVAAVGGLHTDKALIEVKYTLASILIKDSYTTGDTLLDSDLPSTYKDVQLQAAEDIMLKSQQDAVDRGTIKNIIPLSVMKLLMLYMFFGYYNKKRLEDDREKYRYDNEYRNKWTKISSHYDDAGKDTSNDFLSVDESQLIALINLLELTFGKQQIQAFGRKFDADNNGQSISQVLIAASVYFGETRRLLTDEDLRWIKEIGTWMGFRYNPNLMRPAGYDNHVVRHRVHRDELRDHNHLALLSQVISPPFQIRTHSRAYERSLHFFAIPYYMVMLNLPINQVEHRLTLWKVPSRGAYFHQGDGPWEAAGGTYYCFVTYSNRIPGMIDNGELEFNDRDTVPPTTVQ